jgi:hypothetical protein
MNYPYLIYSLVIQVENREKASHSDTKIQPQFSDSSKENTQILQEKI